MANDDSRAVLRDHTGRFRPGSATPNPGGRPRLPDEVLRQTRETLAAATPKAAATLVSLLDDDDPRIQLLAANTILDRVLGKPTQQLNASVDTSTIQEAHLAALQEIQRRAAERRNAEGEGQPN